MRTRLPVSLLAGLVLLTLYAVPASAAPPTHTVPARPSPAWQTNGRVHAIVATGGAVYLAGTFSKVRPPGAAAGSKETSRSFLAAFNASTGTLLPFNHTLDGAVYALALSPDNTRLYAGGAFRTVDGQARGRLAVFDLPLGTLNASWKPSAGATVRALHTRGHTIYMGGTFGRINGVIRNNLAAVTDTGTLLPLSADLDGWVRAITTTPAGSRLIVGGGFSHVNGQTHRAIVSLDSSTGAIRPWAATIPTCSEVTTLIHDSSRVYVGGEGTGGGCFDGFFASNPDTGREVWRDNCRGATQALVLLGGVLYVGSHAHNCGSVLCGGFGETSPRHLLAVNSADGCISSTWRPNTNGKPLGPYALATDGRRLFVGGDFTSVNNLAQQGFTRFG